MAEWWWLPQIGERIPYAFKTEKNQPSFWYPQKTDRPTDELAPGWQIYKLIYNNYTWQRVKKHWKGNYFMLASKMSKNEMCPQEGGGMWRPPSTNKWNSKRNG